MVCYNYSESSVAPTYFVSLLHGVQVFAQSVGKQGVSANIHLNLHFLLPLALTNRPIEYSHAYHEHRLK